MIIVYVDYVVWNLYSFLFRYLCFLRFSNFTFIHFFSKYVLTYRCFWICFEKVDLTCKYKDLMENLIKLIDISSYYLPQSYKYSREYFEIYLFSISLCFLKVICINLSTTDLHIFNIITYFSALSYLVLLFYHDCIILSICL